MINLGLFVILIIFTYSCTSYKKTIKEPIREYGAEYLLEKMDENELQFENISAKFSIDLLIDKKEMAFNGQYRLKKDSALWISFTPLLGIEAMRLMITNDSVKLMNRINKTYFLSDWQFISNFLNTNIDFDVIQSLLIGNDLTYYENTSFRASYDNPQYQLVTSQRRKLKAYIRTNEDASRIYIQNIFMDPESFKITNMKIRELAKENVKLEAVYENFMEIEGQLFPNTVLYDLQAENKIRADINYKKVNIDIPLRFPFKIPAKYERLQ